STVETASPSGLADTASVTGATACSTAGSGLATGRGGSACGVSATRGCGTLTGRGVGRLARLPAAGWAAEAGGGRGSAEGARPPRGVVARFGAGRAHRVAQFGATGGHVVAESAGTVGDPASQQVAAGRDVAGHGACGRLALGQNRGVQRAGQVGRRGR